MTIEYASYQDMKALLTRGAVLFKTSEGARESSRVASGEDDSEKAHNIFCWTNVILMDSQVLSPRGGIHADVP
jgi:hypothetical protein